MTKTVINTYSGLLLLRYCAGMQWATSLYSHGKSILWSYWKVTRYPYKQYIVVSEFKIKRDHCNPITALCVLTISNSQHVQRVHKGARLFESREDTIGWEAKGFNYQSFAYIVRSLSLGVDVIHRVCLQPHQYIDRQKTACSASLRETQTRPSGIYRIQLLVRFTALVYISKW